MTEEQPGFPTSPLAEALVERGLLRREQARLALRLAELSGLTFPEYLQQRGLVDAATLADVVQQVEAAEEMLRPLPEPPTPAALEGTIHHPLPLSLPFEQEESERPAITIERSRIETISEPTAQRASQGAAEELAPVPSITEVPRHTLVVCRVEAQNAAPEEVAATVSVAPDVRTRLSVRCEASPRTVHEGQQTAVMVTIAITNTGSKVATQPHLSLRSLPAWFEVQDVIRWDTLASLPFADHIMLEDLHPGQSITVVAHGIARP